ncbi:MAG: hypothetical protein D6729_19610 [Deltaproteobacteria bacterium]|nr:MAG: hypothetical protein D6729_19610 [Deltaproteobacteria bacterium]
MRSHLPLHTPRGIGLLGAASLLLLAACGGSDPGGGTKTLYVNAATASDGSRDGTWIVVEVREGSSDGAIVDDAVVTVTDDEGNARRLNFSGVSIGNFAAGVYADTDFDFKGGTRLEVERGSDHLFAYLEHPGITTITQPIANTTFRRTEHEALRIEWKDARGRSARFVHIKLDRADYERTLENDPGFHEVEVNRLKPGANETLHVERYNEIQLAGGVTGSRFRATTVHRIDFDVE